MTKICDYCVKAFLTMLSLFLILSLAGCGDIKLSRAATEYTGSNYKKVIDELKQSGFNDIATTEVADLSSSGAMTDGAVSEVSIDGNTEFDSKTSFSRDAKVVVTYHIIKKLPTPINLDQISDMDYVEIADAFTSAGFTNVQKRELYDLDPDETSNEYQNEIKVNNKTLSENSDELPFDVVINVIRHYPYAKYDLQLNVDFVGNLLFSKYDVNLSVDGDNQDTLKHGKDWQGTLRLKEGEHEITFVNTEDSSVNGKTALDLMSNAEVEYKICCYSDEITVETVYLDKEEKLADNEIKVLCTESDYLDKNFKEIEKELKDLGFKNIKTIPIYDIIFGITEEGAVNKVSINGSNDFKRGDIFLNDVDVMIEYHMPHDDEPKNESSEAKNESSETTNEDAENKPEKAKSKAKRAKMRKKVKGKTYVHVRDLMKDMGYIANYIHEESNQDLTEDLTNYTDEELNSVGFTVTGIEKMNSKKKTITLYINSTENIERKKMQKVLYRR